MEDKILLLIPNYGWFGKRKWNSLPFAVPIIASILKDYNLEIIDANINDYSEKELSDLLKEKTASLILVSTISYAYSRIYHRMTEIVKNARPDATLLIGGVYVTTCIEHVMEDPNIDIAMMGHAEDRLKLIVDAILHKDKEAVEKSEGIAFRKDGEVTINPLVSNIADVKRMVKPDYSRTSLKQYISKVDAISTNFVNESKKRFANVLTSYGCPYNCLFCASRSISGRKVVVRPADDVLEELDYLVNECKIELLNIMDDNILFDKERAIYILNEIIRRNYNIEIRIDNLAIWHLDKEILNLLKEAGCTRLGVSIESGCERVLHKIIRKPLKLEIVKPIREMCRDTGILVQANFIIGFPGETWIEIRESLQFAEECDFDLVSIHIATPMPKTDLYEYAIKQGVLADGFSFYDDTHLGATVGYLTTDEFTPQELEIMRAYEWDRINFSTPEKRKRALQILEMEEDELKEYRKQTRLNLGHFIR